MSKLLNIEEVWSNYRSSIKAFLLSRVSEKDEIDDLLQTILIKTYRNLDAVKSERSLKPWLFQIANRAIIDFYRSRKNTTELTEADLWYEDTKGSSVFNDFSSCIESFVDALPPDSADLLKAIDIQGQSQKEYAQANGIAYTTLKSRVTKGRNQLKKIFEDCCHLELDQFGNVVDYESKSANVDCCD
jgi:RNA polymerase sigma-70 factor (ECF subfamily)